MAVAASGYKFCEMLKTPSEASLNPPLINLIRLYLLRIYLLEVDGQVVLAVIWLEHCDVVDSHFILFGHQAGDEELVNEAIHFISRKFFHVLDVS